MKLPEISPNEMQHKVNDTVWVISARRPTASRVLSIKLELCASGKDDGLVILCMGYRLDVLNLDARDWTFRPHEVYVSEESAKELAKWHSVSGLAEDEWKKAIGDRDDGESLDECELSRCCANISSARDILFKCKKDSGLMERDVRHLQELLDKHYPLPKGQRPKILDKIIEQLGVLEKIAPARESE